MKKILVLGLVATCFALSAYGATDFAGKLKKSGQLQIPYQDCADSAAKLGQLLYINVDDHGNPEGVIDPGYIKLVEEIQPGGMIVHSDDLLAARASLEKIFQVSQLPPMTGVDFLRAKLKKGSVNAGQGYQGGLIGKLGNAIPPACLGRVAYVDAFLHRALGINQALGPTVEYRESDGVLKKSSKERASIARHVIQAYQKIGVNVAMKHFPHVPETSDNHKKLNNETLSPAEEAERMGVFRELRTETDFLMTTHYWNSNIDKEIVTLSKAWIDKLRNEVGYKGIIMTDGMYMMGNWGADVSAASSQNAPYQLKDPPLSDIAIFSARAILAGHDMIMLESTASDTRKVFRELHRLSCQDSAIGRELARRIRESYDRIYAYKERHKAKLVLAPPVPEELIREASEAYGLHYYGGFIDSEMKPYSADSPICKGDFFDKLKKKIQQIRGGLDQWERRSRTIPG